jgi:DNA-binding HxlR family transcriptional regulator
MEDIMDKSKNCPVESTLELIGGKYKALILWHLSEKTLRFSQLRKEISGATAKMLTQQLRELEAQDLIHREVFPIIPPKVEYSLTELGKSLMPILTAMRDWGADYLKTKKLEPNCFMMKQDPVPTKTN